MDDMVKWAVPPLLGALIWLVRLEGRINGHDASLEDLKDTIRDMRGEVHYVRQRIDEALRK